MQTKHWVRFGVLAIVIILIAIMLVGASADGEADAHPRLPKRDSVGAAVAEAHDQFVLASYLQELHEQEVLKTFLEDHQRKEKVAEALRARQAQEARRAAIKRPVRSTKATTLAMAPQKGTGRCGGSLPPCRVMMRESGGDIRIWNGGCYAPVGWRGKSPCGSSSASGKWQFVRGTWGGHGGYVNAADAPEHVQDEKARMVWAGGAGCGHWSAC